MLAVALFVFGCAVKRIENGVYHSPKGYRVTIPGRDWAPADESPADLDVRHRATTAGIAVHAVCEGAAPRRAPDVLARQLVIGLRDRAVVERGTIEIAGRPASRVVLDARLGDSRATVRVETVTMTDDRCVYDLMHVAPPATFDATHDDFTRFVGSFRTE
jgi:hypothetical protein